MSDIAVIGLGTMGMPIATRLAGVGHRVVGYDVAPAARAALAEVDGAEVADSAAAAASGADVVILMLWSSVQVEEVLDAGGVLAAMAPGAMLIDMGSSSPLSTTRIAERAAARGVRFVDAPVSGGGHWGASAGTMTIIIGGRDEDVAACMPLFDVLGQTVRHVGPIGAGHALKAINNLLSAVTLLASSEALDMGERFGLDPALMLEVINASSGQSDSTSRKLPRFVVTKTYNSGGPLRGMVKDIHNATTLAEDMGLALRLGSLATEMWETAAAELPDDADYTEIARWVAGEVDPAA
jgi:3-hydroxyisobutyrate dehydrogenase